MSTAMSENAKMQCLSNDLVRRLLNTKEELPIWYRAQVVDDYGRKLLTSGYGYNQTKKILANGAKGYLAKVTRLREQGGRRIYRTAEESSKGRARKKLLGKTAWYKDRSSKKKVGEQLTTLGGRSRNSRNQGRIPTGNQGRRP